MRRYNLIVMNKVIHFSITLKYSVYFLIPLFLIGCAEIGEPDEPPIPDYHTIIQRHLAGKIYGARITSHSRRGNFVTYLADGRITVWASPLYVMRLYMNLSLIHISEPTRPY